MELFYSFIIPVYNRPDEIAELLASFAIQVTDIPFEIVIVEDGSTMPCLAEVEKHPELQISYFVKNNSGPGSSRNFGMAKAKGNYFIILDSDCILPSTYIRKMHDELREHYIDIFGGPDAAHPQFSNLQKAISYSMTSIFTTGGLRGGGEDTGKFQPRSFNMGLSKKAFEASGGFGKIHPGEDPDLVLRLWKLGFKSRLIKDAFVYHKRRISWKKFHTQVYKFGLVRPILNNWHPDSKKITYWFPSLFVFGFSISLLLVPFNSFLFIVYSFYFLFILAHSAVLNKSLAIGFMSVFATLVQFYGYGKGFLLSTIEINWRGKLPRKRFPHLFFK